MNAIKRNLNTTLKTSRTIVRLFTFYMSILLIFSGCDQDDFVEVELPPQLATAETIFSSISTANTAVAGVYSLIQGSFLSNISPDASEGYTSLFALYADEVKLLDSFSLEVPELYSNFLLPESRFSSGMWNASFKLIHAANRVIEGIRQSSTIADGPEKDQLLGEAYFMRAFTHFFLNRVFGEVPYIKTSDFVENSTASRLPVIEVYANITEDLELAISLLQEEYIDENRTRANKSTARAVLARAYLFQEDWANVNVQSTLVLENAIYTWEPNSENVFITDSPATIWQLDVGRDGVNTEYSTVFSDGANMPIADQTLATFEDGDLRLDIHTAPAEDFFSGEVVGTNIFKYKDGLFGEFTTERYKLIRMAELYLIRAEARAQLNDITGAQSDINIVRERAGLASTVANTRETLLGAIMQERRIELLGESGHRWFDLKRTGQADAVLSTLPEKTGWETPRSLLFPIPQSDRLLNPELSQNPGY